MNLIEIMTGVAICGIAAVVVTGYKSNPFQHIDQEAKDLAKYGKLTADLSCAEQSKFSQNLSDYFQKSAKDGATNPVFVLTKEDCLRLMSEKNARTANAVAAVPAP